VNQRVRSATDVPLLSGPRLLQITASVRPFERPAASWLKRIPVLHLLQRESVSVTMSLDPKRLLPSPLLQKMKVLGPLSVEEEQLIADATSHVRQVAAREDIARDRDQPTASSLILEGFACCYKLLPNGKRQILAFQVPGDFCDIQTYVLHTLNYSIGALTPCTVAAIPHTAILEMTEAHPAIGQALLREIFIDSAIYRQWIASIGRRTACERTAHLLCELMMRLHSVGLTYGFSYRFPVTQADLGDALGLSVVHVNRVLQRLRRGGLITFRSGTLVILDWQRLKHLAQFDASYLQVPELNVH